MVRSKSVLDHRLRDVRGQFGVTLDHGHGRGPQPSSAGVELRGRADGEGGGIISRLKAVAWSLKTRKITSGLLSIHCLENS